MQYILSLFDYYHTYFPARDDTSFGLLPLLFRAEDLIASLSIDSRERLILLRTRWLSACHEAFSA